MAHVMDVKAPRHSRPIGRRRVGAVIGVIAALAAVLVLGSVLVLAIFHADEGRPIPAFPSLAAHPDSSLQGTVAYTYGPSRCVRIVAAAGQPSKDVLCLGTSQPKPAQAAVQAKEVNVPQLVWRPDGRLEVTMLLMQAGPGTAGKAPAYTPEWQKLVDVRTGGVEDVPASQLPSATNQTTRPSVNPAGQQLTYTSDEPTGRVKVTLTGATGTRTLLSAHGPGEYGYRLYSVFWAPNWQWIAADDGRILVITPGDRPVTRVLVDGAGGERAFPTFAVTTQNLLAPTAPDVQAALEDALDTGNVPSLAAWFAPSVEYAVAASGSFGTTSAALAVQQVATYFKDAPGPWNFAIPPTTLEAYRQGPYHRYLVDDTYFGVSPGKFFVSVRVNAAGKIDQVFMAANTGLLE